MSLLLRLAILSGPLLVCGAGALDSIAQSATGNDLHRHLDLQFQSAEARYREGKFPEAAAQLENLSISLPESFEVHELLGLTYAAQSQNEKSIEQLEIAVQLKPGSAVARTNLAAGLVHAGRLKLAEVQLRKALTIAPQSFTANHDLADFYIQSNRIADALPFLERAQRIDPSSYNNGYDLALAYLLTEQLVDARKLVDSLANKNNTGELHSLLGQIEEKEGRFVEAANEFETSARLDPSEDSLFAWGGELLLHRTYDPAIDVFQKASASYPNSPRLRIGLGMALYARSRYEESIRSLLIAAALDPADARCYLFLYKAYLSSPGQANEVIEAFRRYAELQPNRPLALYYYAMSLWKGRRLDAASVDIEQVTSLLHRCIALDSTFADAHLQLGIFYADQRDFDKAFPEYQQALKLNPDLSDAHYRLGQYYVHAGQKTLAESEFTLYQRLEAQRMAAVDKEKADVQQFVYSAKSAGTGKR